MLKGQTAVVSRRFRPNGRRGISSVGSLSAITPIIRWSWLGSALVFLLLVSVGLFASLFVGARPAQASYSISGLVTVSSQRERVTFNINRQHSQFLDTSLQSFLHYLPLDPGNTCPVWVQGGSPTWTSLAIRQPLTGYEKFTYSVSVPLTTDKICIAVVFHGSYLPVIYQGEEQITIDTAPPIITIHEDIVQGAVIKYRMTAWDFDSSIDQRFSRYRFGTASFCQDSNQYSNPDKGIVGRRGTSFTVRNYQVSDLQGKYICFSATDTVGNSSTVSRAINITINLPDPPVIPPPTKTAAVVTISQLFVPVSGKEDRISLTFDVHSVSPDVVEWRWAYVINNSTSCSSLSYSREPKITGPRQAKEETGQGMARRDYSICVRSKTASGGVAWHRWKLKPQDIKLRLWQWLGSDNRVRVYAHSSSVYVGNLGVHLGDEWKFTVDSVLNRNPCADVIDRPGTFGVRDMNEVSLQTAMTTVDPSPPAPGVLQRICVRAETYNGDRGHGGLVLIRADGDPENPGEERLRCKYNPAILASDPDCKERPWVEQRASIAARGCKIVFESSEIFTYDAGGDRVVPAAVKLELWHGSAPASSQAINGNAIDVEKTLLSNGRIRGDDDEIVDLDGATAAQINHIKNQLTGTGNWQFRIYSYYPNSGLTTELLHNSDGLIPATITDRQVDITIDLSALTPDCNVDVPPCAPAPYTFTLNNPVSSSSSNRSISYDATYWDPGDPSATPPIDGSENLYTASGNINYTPPAFRALTPADVANMLEEVAVNGVLTDTASSLTIDSSHPATLRAEFSSPSILTQTASTTFTPNTGLIPPDDFPGTYPWPTWGWGRTGSVTYRLDIRVVNVYRLNTNNNRIGTISRPGSSTLNSGDDHLFEANDTNSYASANIQRYEWDIEWTLRVRHQGAEYSYWDLAWDSVGEYYYADQERVVNLPQTNATFRGTWRPCTRSLLVQPPACQVYYPPSFAFANELEEEFFDPNTSGGSNRVWQDNMFPVGRAIARTQVRVANFNPFNLQTNSGQHPRFNVTAQSPYASGYNPYSGESSSKNYGINIRYYESGRNDHIEYYHEPTNAINYPGKYQTTWTVNWQTDTQYAQNWPAGSTDWSGIEHTDNRCAPSSQLSKTIYVYAEPPTCTVSAFLFEVNENPQYTEITLHNPNQAPMRVDRADWAVSRGITLNGSMGTSTIPAAGSLSLRGNFGPVDYSGQFRALWTIETSMGTEAWTSHDDITDQNSWFEDPGEHIEPPARPGDYCQEDGKIVRKPFIKVFFGSLLGGGQFGSATKYDACNDFTEVVGNPGDAAQAFVAGHSEGNSISDARGSSVEYALLANHEINGFYSASQRSLFPRPLKGLTLSNNGTDPYGSSFGKKTCLANYWREAEKIDAEIRPFPLQLDVNDLRDNDRKRFNLPGETLEITNGAVDSLNLKATVYVNGDVHITSDIINNQGAVWRDPSEIGYLTIIAHGNIYIDKGVGRIDALLVAYPRESGGVVTDGTVMTCYYPGIVADDGSVVHFHTCDNQLTINGAIVAEKILFGRTYGSVKLETGYPASPDPLDPHYTQAAEIINLLPEYSIGIPELPLFPDQIYRTDSLSTKPVNF